MASTISTEASASEEYKLPISMRPKKSALWQAILFNLVFNFCIISIHLLQIVSLPLTLHPSTKPYFERIITYTKLAFGRTLVLISQLFGPTKLVISFGDGKGGFLDPNSFVRRDKQSARIDFVDLPRRSIWMANHQVYTDWLYLWCLAYYADLADSILIILKKSLKWLPFIGWGMQFFRFIFLARNWAADQTTLTEQLGQVASKSDQKNPTLTTTNGINGNAETASKSKLDSVANKLLLLIFPEGTLVSADTRPLSKKYADKMGYNDLENLLLPRSTGLLFCLRKLAKEMDDLWLVDFAIGYPGIPPAGYGQSFYTLRSIFMQGVPPPAIHLHIVMTRVTEPQTASCNSATVSNVETSHLDVPPLGDLTNQDSTDDEKTVFDKWLRQRWTAKDELMRDFYKDGDFVGGDSTKPGANNSDKVIVLPVELRQLKEIGDAFCWGISLAVLRFVWKGFRLVSMGIFS